jgi:predicted glutamine amidotransferase
MSSCNSHKDLQEDELFAILNGIIENDSISMDTISFQFSELALNGAYKMEFSEQDLQFINRQSDLYKNYHIKPNKLKKYYWRTMHTDKSPYIPIDSIYGKNSYYKISFPIISSDRKKVIIEISGGWGWLSGSSGIYLFTYKDGHWTKTRTYESIIS